MDKNETCSCESCCKKIPKSAALTAEGADYTWHFCSKKCYEQWHSAKKPKSKENNED